MNFDNPLEIIIAVILVLASIWIVERIIAGAFKTVIAAIFIVGILSFFTYTKHTTKHKPLPKIGLRDLTDYNSFKQKAALYKDQTIKDLKEDYFNAKKDIKQNK